MYTKNALTIDEQIDQLSHRGLILDEDAVHFLSHISYYRLAGYWWPMQKEPKEEHQSFSISAYCLICKISKCRSKCTRNENDLGK